MSNPNRPGRHGKPRYTTYEEKINFFNVKFKLWSNPNPKCHWCGRKLVRRYEDMHLYPGSTKGTMEHLLPLSQGGETSLDNCVLVCNDCNHKRGNPEDPKQGPYGIKKSLPKDK